MDGWVKSTIVKSHGLRVDARDIRSVLRNPCASSVDTRGYLYGGEKGTIMSSLKVLKLPGFLAVEARKARRADR